MSFTILILAALLLSTVVRVTDSCSSFTGWKLRKAADLPQKEHKIQVEVSTTENIDQIENKNISANKMYQPITVPIILPVGKKYERCDRALEKLYCHKRGKCIMIEDYNENAEIEKKGYCICDPGYAGKRCMEKSPDNHYLTLIEEDRRMKEILSQTSSSTTTEATTTESRTTESTTTESTTTEMITTTRSSTSKELGKKAPCPSPWNEDYCISGVCYRIPDLSATDYFCTCHDGYTGTRCHEKMADFHYESFNRERRHIPDVRRRKYLLNHKFRTKT